MFKPTPALQKTLRRLPLSTKQAGKEYYKGNGVGSLGTISKFGNFKVDWSKVRTFVYPSVDPKSSRLTPFVDASLEKVGSDDSGFFVYPERLTGKDYLKTWKKQGGHDVVVEEEGAGAGAYRNMPQPFEEKAGRK